MPNGKAENTKSKTGVATVKGKSKSYASEISTLSADSENLETTLPEGTPRVLASEAYDPKTWIDGEVIYDEDLNHMEQGIKNNSDDIASLGDNIESVSEAASNAQSAADAAQSTADSAQSAASNAQTTADSATSKNTEQDTSISTNSTDISALQTENTELKAQIAEMEEKISQLNSDLIVVESFTQSGNTVNAGSYGTFDVPISKDGYTAIGIVGVVLQNGDSGSNSPYACIYGFFIYGNSTARVRLTNRSSSSAFTTEIVVYVLFRKNA